MSTNKIFFLALAVCSLAACAKDTFITYTGNMPSEDKIEQVRMGMTREEVKNILGTPSSVVALDRDTWIYMSAEIEQVAFLKPEEKERKLLVIKFNQDGNVFAIQHKSRANGKNINISEAETPTPEQDQGFFRKYFGGVGQYAPFGGSTPKNNM